MLQPQLPGLTAYVKKGKQLGKHEPYICVDNLRDLGRENTCKCMKCLTIYYHGSVHIFITVIELKKRGI